MLARSSLSDMRLFVVVVFFFFFFVFFFFVIFCLKLPQGLYYMSANSKGSGEIALMRTLA